MIFPVIDGALICEWKPQFLVSGKASMAWRSHRTCLRPNLFFNDSYQHNSSMTPLPLPPFPIPSFPCYTSPAADIIHHPDLPPTPPPSWDRAQGFSVGLQKLVSCFSAVRREPSLQIRWASGSRSHLCKSLLLLPTNWWQLVECERPLLVAGRLFVSCLEKQGGVLGCVRWNRVKFYRAEQPIKHMCVCSEHDCIWSHLELLFSRSLWLRKTAWDFCVFVGFLLLWLFNIYVYIYI